MSEYKELIISCFIVVGVAVSWACSTQFTKSALSLDSRRFYAPYTLVWFNTSFMTLCFPVYLLYNHIRNKTSIRESYRDASTVFGKPMLRNAILRVTPFLVMWVAPNYSYSQSLGHISASAASSILSSNTVIVCLLSWAILKEPLLISRCVAVILAVAGVVIISLDREFTASAIGIGLALFSALTAAIYKVGFKFVNGNATLGQVSLFMSTLGAIDLCLNSIPTGILVYTGADHIELGYIPWLPLVGAALLSMMFNFLVNFGIALLNPLVISVGMVSGLPLNIAIDIVFRGIQTTPTFLVGSTFIIVSFVLTTFPCEEKVKKWLSSRGNIDIRNDIHEVRYQNP
ncbi:eamA-like transporter family domain-containing protein [Ditylenchus destructor]|uniref:EamA-like transporter family domain-containing protein n=1 Tax=Ditylenchus destructor TaxID=166010 RepID=A0AAD4N9S5_9BILA|nr:eamA-like transporter family domain-containing protein [Ditylenchus destructor]